MSSHPLLAQNDYRSGSKLFHFGLAQANSQCIDFSIVDDNFVEDMEKFSLSLTTTNDFVNVVPDSGEVEIIDNDSK